MELETSYETPVRLVASQNFRIDAAVPNPTAWDLPVEVRIYDEGEYIFKENDDPQALYVLKSGSVKLVNHQACIRGRMVSGDFITRVVAPGEFFGFRPVLRETKMTESARCLRRSEVQIYSKDSIAQILQGPATILKSFLQHLGREMESQENMAQAHYLASVQERIAHQLLQLADRFGVPTGEGLLLNLRLSRNELAQLAGTINESLSRHLTELKSEGILGLQGKDILVKNRAALMAKAGNLG